MNDPAVELLPEEGRPAFPRTRAECLNGPRPCPWVRCRHHLWLKHIGIRRYGYKMRTSAPMPWEMPHTCALDVVDANPQGVTRYYLAALLGETQQGVDYTEKAALDHLAARLELVGITAAIAREWLGRNRGGKHDG